jgi:hypothetical protein
MYLFFVHCLNPFLLLSSVCPCIAFKLHSEEIERWFTKIDHIFEHTRVPKIGEVLTPFYKIYVDKEQHHHLPLVSHINYK